MGSKFSERVKARTAGGVNTKNSVPWWQGFTAPTLFLAIASTVLTLLGYGVARAHDSMFGFSYALWYETPVELMAMSGDAFIGWLNAIEKALRNVSTLQSAGTAGLVIASMALSFMAGQWFRTAPQADLWRKHAAYLFARCATWLFTPKFKFGEQVAHATVTAAAAGVIGGLSALSGLLVLLMVIAAICLIPLLGFIGGGAYARASIVEPTSCVSPIAVRLRVKSTGVGAPCVTVTDSTTGKTVVGRLILARGTRLFLYSKEDDRASMYTIKDVSISTVHVLPHHTRPSEARLRGEGSTSPADL